MLTSGARLGPYEIVGSLGAGGMGEVYRARDLRLNRTVAIDNTSVCDLNKTADPNGERYGASRPCRVVREGIHASNRRQRKEYADD
jgi:hypothetical protein